MEQGDTNETGAYPRKQHPSFAVKCWCSLAHSCLSF